MEKAAAILPIQSDKDETLGDMVGMQIPQEMFQILMMKRIQSSHC